jgi:hypothetical protein
VFRNSDSENSRILAIPNSEKWVGMVGICTRYYRSSRQNDKMLNSITYNCCSKF